MSLQRFKISVANTVINADNASLNTMDTAQLLDLFTVSGNAGKVRTFPIFVALFYFLIYVCACTWLEVCIMTIFSLVKMCMTLWQTEIMVKIICGPNPLLLIKICG